MATWTPSSAIIKSAKSSLFQGIDEAATIWDKHTIVTQTNTATETESILGSLPVPRHLINGRNFQDLRDWSMTVTARGYELSFIIDRDFLADDQTGKLNERMREVGAAYATFKDSLFTDLLTNGNVDSGFDGSTFHSASRQFGTETTWSNLVAQTVGSTSAISSTDALNAIAAARVRFLSIQDDRGRAGFNNANIKDLRLVVHPGHERGFAEALGSALLGGGDSNPFGLGLAEVDVNPYFTGSTEIFVSAGKPFLLHQRQPLEVVMSSSTEQVAMNHGLRVLAYERFRFAYGDARKSILMTLSV